MSRLGYDTKGRLRTGCGRQFGGVDHRRFLALSREKGECECDLV